MTRWRDFLACALVVLGLLQTIGFITGITAIRGIGLASTASPLPLVFTQFRGVETFAEKYDLDLVTADGQRIQAQITPTLYSRLKGPYKRRNAYGAVIAYGPALTLADEKRMVDSVLRYGFCNSGPLAMEFGVFEPLREVDIHIISQTAGRPDRWILSVRCPS